MITLRAWVAILLSAGLHAADDPTARQTLRQYCVSCHGKSNPAAGLSIDALSSQSPGESFLPWEKIATALESKRMPPPKLPQPSDAARARTAQWIRATLREYATKHAGDPGRVTVRRLTSGEYAYTIKDLTGLDLKVDRDFVPDAVGGEGFANFGDVQFMQDASLDRYLHMAKQISAHAIIGAGPLQFYPDAGQSGLELSAIHRIQDIYTAHGFRASSAEGGKPYGLDLYTRAIFVCWQYQHRQALGQPSATLASLAARERVSTRFAEHIWAFLHKPSPRFPSAEVIRLFHQLPPPSSNQSAVREACKSIQKFVVDWPRWLFAAGGVAEGGQGDERALVLTEESVQVTTTHRFRYLVRFRDNQPSRIHLSVLSANPNARDHAAVLWKAPTIRFRKPERSPGDQRPLHELLDQPTRDKLGFGRSVHNTEVRPQDFTTPAGEAFFLDIPTPPNTGSVELQVEAVLLNNPSGEAVLRTTLADKPDSGRPMSALLGDPKSPALRAWKDAVIDYAAHLPQTSHGEPTPADRDPIPPPYNNAYNQPERDSFHTRVKYYRTDAFLMDKILDDATRRDLNAAWHDLLASTNYNDEFLKFIDSKFSLRLNGKSIAALTSADIAALPAEPRPHVARLHAESAATRDALLSAEPRHLDDCLRLAARAWRRPLSAAEQQSLRAFYTQARNAPQSNHDKALRSLIARIFVAPQFLYRLEQPAVSSAPRQLAPTELAARLSFFLWSSIPDAELNRAATSGELATPSGLQKQVKRMLADPKARRLATEFFGQWLGFYRFDQFNGVDTSRFPEFTSDVKAAMYDEAVSFFEHIVRRDRPVKEMLAADYAFLNPTLAKHYGLDPKLTPAKDIQQVPNASAFQRGGMLRLGAVLTSTSAPLRTSPVKRGDWLLRRVLGTPTPPPPADAGSIPADEKAFGGLSLAEKLKLHQRNATCAGCHMRIDPLGFPLERFDAVGRWRETYSDGKPVTDSSTTADQQHINGVNGLLSYLQTQEKQVLRNFSHKLLGYALGRTVLLSDQPLIDRMAASGFETSFSQFVLSLVQSRQFQFRREDLAPSLTASSKAGAQ